MNYLLLNRSKKARNKNKIGLPPNKRYHLTPLARHKSENISKYCHNNKIDPEKSSHILYVLMSTSIPLLHPQPLLLHILDQLLELAHAN